METEVGESGTVLGNVVRRHENTGEGLNEIGQG